MKDQNAKDYYTNPSSITPKNMEPKTVPCFFNLIPQGVVVIVGVFVGVFVGGAVVFVGPEGVFVAPEGVSVMDAAPETVIATQGESPKYCP
jgi:hypothetical protein